MRRFIEAANGGLENPLTRDIHDTVLAGKPWQSATLTDHTALVVRNLVNQALDGPVTDPRGEEVILSKSLALAIGLIAANSRTIVPNKAAPSTFDPLAMANSDHAEGDVDYNVVDAGTTRSRNSEDGIGSPLADSYVFSGFDGDYRDLQDGATEEFEVLPQ